VKRATKARILADKIDEEHQEVEHLYRILKTNIQPEDHSQSGSYRTEAMHLLKTAMNALEEAATYVRDIV